MWSNIKINIAARFKTLIVCEADGQLSQSFAWNNIWLNQMWGAIDYFVVSSVNNGWPNANLVYGGSFGYSSNDITGLNSNIMSFVKAISDGKYHSNAWTFYGCQFEGGSLANNSHIECINCSNSLIRGWRFRDIRYEAHDNTMRLGILCNTSDSYADVQVDFMFAIGDVNSNTLTFTNGCKNINTAADAFLLDTGSIANNLKKAGAIYLIKNMDSFHYRSNTGLFNSTTSFSSYFPMHLYKLDEQVSIRVYANGRIFFGICDENMNIITNNDGLLTSQIDNIVRTGITFTVINNCLIRSGGDAATSYQQVNILTIPTAKYIFFCHNTIDPDNAIKIQVQRLSFKKMHKISFKGRVRPNDAYWYFSGLPNTIVTNWEKEDKYYITSTDQLYRITKSGVGLQYSGLTVTGTSGTSTLTVNAGDMTKFIEGAEFTIAGDSTVYKIKSMDTTALTINVQTNLITSPTTATVTFIAAEYELVNYLKTGTTAQRPTTLTSTQFGALYYDTTIDKHVFWNGSAWVDYRTTSQANSTATDIATLQTDFNALLEKLKSAGLMS
ncbi:hypothetical protein A8C56_07865 [Niabella ginsenosidivorans]|uniref:Uncharacterized protein n=1 Tax=Niabella ginsenosidivorans TaxID=1176587 RepID=A0A1A9HZS8_9BACT|nr:hypothetical protein [Niabella ginsenosidivorans]ANH80907.1 hypothetical protein A8C56_07865 [Niabella ginsenosidivorans]